MAKQYWIKRSTLPLDKNKRKLVTTTLRWKEEDRSRMIGGAFGMTDKHITIGADTVVEGDHFAQFVKEGILEEKTEARAKRDDAKLSAVKGPPIAFTSAPPAEVLAKPLSTAPKAGAPAPVEEKQQEKKKDEKKKDEKKSGKKFKK